MVRMLPDERLYKRYLIKKTLCIDICRPLCDQEGKSWWEVYYEMEIKDLYINEKIGKVVFLGEIFSRFMKSLRNEQEVFTGDFSVAISLRNGDKDYDVALVSEDSLGLALHTNQKYIRSIFFT